MQQEKSTAAPGKRVCRRLAWLLPGPLALLLFRLAQNHSAWVDRIYVEHVYPFIRYAMQWISLLPNPMVTVLAAGAALALVLGFLAALIMSLAKKRLRPLMKYGYGVLVGAGMLYAWFILAWGFQYHRTPIETHLKITLDAREPTALRELCMSLIDQANALQENGLEAPEAQAVLGAVPALFESAGEEWALWPEGPIPAPKDSGINSLLSSLMIEGIYSPFTMEPLINTAIPNADLPFTACHEVAHGLGFAREEEANFIAYLVCAASEDPYFRYSGIMGALRYALPAFGEVDAAAYWACYERISDSVRLDMAARDAYWLAMQESTIAIASQQMNDGYLSVAAQQPDGARSYGRVVDLILALEEN